MFLFIWKLKTPMSPNVPTLWPLDASSVALGAIFEQPETVLRGDPLHRLHVSRRAAHVHHDDPFGVGVMRFSRSTGSRQKVSSISASTGIAPWFTTAASTDTHM